MPAVPPVAIQGLRRKILFCSVTYTLAALLIVSTVSTWPLLRSMRRFEENNLLHAVQIRTLAVEEYLNSIKEITLQIGSRSQLRRALDHYAQGRWSLDRLREFSDLRMDEARRASSAVLGLIRLSADGHTVAQNGIYPTAGHNPEIFSLLTRHAAATYLVDPFVLQGELVLAVVNPIFSFEGAAIGQDIVFFSTAKLQRILWDKSGMGKTGESFLGKAPRNQAVLFFPGRKGEEETYNQDIQSPLLTTAFALSAAGKTGVSRVDSSQNGKQWVVAYAPVAGTAWGLVLTMDDREFMAPLRNQFASLAASVLLLLALGAFGMGAILRPMTGRVLVYTRELDNLNQELQQEVKERQTAENNLRRSENQWEQTFEAITDAVAIVDSKGQILKMNHAASSLVRELGSAYPGYDGHDLIFDSRHFQDDCSLEQLLREKEPRCCERSSPSNERFFQISLYPLIDHANEIWGGVYVTHEITERKKMERAKDEMISAVSHEMRTPLTAILGFVEFMLDNEVDREQQVDFLRTVLQETERLNELISNFLDLQRLQAEIGQYQFTEVEICPLFEQAVSQFRMTSQKHILQIECSEKLPPAKADARRILQVIKNLVSNAVKYSPEGGEIVCAARQEGEMLLISVRDQGMGIALAERERIFEQFYRIDDSEKRIPGGIGLGLALVREVVRAHGGRVWLESEVGVGSTFYFSLPIATYEQLDSEPAQEHQL